MSHKLILGLGFSFLVACNSNSSSHSQPAPAPTADVPVNGNQGSTPTPTPTPDPDTNPDQPTEPQLGGLVDGARITSADMFRNLGDGIARKTAAFSQATTQLSQAIDSFCSDPANIDKAPVQLAWKNTMLLWEQLEVLQIGPIAAGEKLLKTNIYGWPQLANTCRIDEEALKASKSSTYALPPNANRKGLQSLEYLLYEPSLLSSCSNSSASKREWDGLTATNRALARCAYLKPLIAELQNNANTLVQVWGTEGNNFLTAAIGNSAAEKVALQSVFENLFYLDIEVKNYKLASPAGHDPKFCASSPAPCPGKDEFPLSQISRDAIEANITAFTDLVYGFADANNHRPGGFAALVRQAGDEKIAARSESLTRELVQYFSSQSDSLATLIAKQNNENCEQTQNSLLCKLRKSIKQISYDFKYEYGRLLSVTVPAGPAGDND